MRLDDFFDDKFKIKWVRRTELEIRDIFIQITCIIHGISKHRASSKIQNPCGWLTRGLTDFDRNGYRNDDAIIVDEFENTIPPYSEVDSDVKIISIVPNATSTLAQTTPPPPLLGTLPLCPADNEEEEETSIIKACDFPRLGESPRASSTMSSTFLLEKDHTPDPPSQPAQKEGENELLSELKSISAMLRMILERPSAAAAGGGSGGVATRVK